MRTFGTIVAIDRALYSRRIHNAHHTYGIRAGTRLCAPLAAARSHRLLYKKVVAVARTAARASSAFIPPAPSAS